MAKENIFQRAVNFLKNTYDKIFNPEPNPEYIVDLGNTTLPTDQPLPQSIKIDNDIMNRFHEELDYISLKQLEKNPEKINSTLKLGLGHFIQEEFRNNADYLKGTHLENNTIFYSEHLPEGVDKNTIFDTLKNKLFEMASLNFMNYLAEPEFADKDYITKLTMFNGDAYSAPQDVHQKLQSLCRNSTIRVVYDPYPPLQEQIKGAKDFVNRQDFSKQSPVIGDMML